METSSIYQKLFLELYLFNTYIYILDIYTSLLRLLRQLAQASNLDRKYTIFESVEKAFEDKKIEALLQNIINTLDKSLILMKGLEELEYKDPLKTSMKSIHFHTLEKLLKLISQLFLIRIALKNVIDSIGKQFFKEYPIGEEVGRQINYIEDYCIEIKQSNMSILIESSGKYVHVVRRNNDIVLDEYRSLFIENNYEKRLFSIAYEMLRYGSLVSVFPRYEFIKRTMNVIIKTPFRSYKFDIMRDLDSILRLLYIIDFVRYEMITYPLGTRSLLYNPLIDRFIWNDKVYAKTLSELRKKVPYMNFYYNPVFGRKIGKYRLFVFPSRSTVVFLSEQVEAIRGYIGYSCIKVIGKQGTIEKVCSEPFLISLDMASIVDMLMKRGALNMSSSSIFGALKKGTKGYKIYLSLIDLENGKKKTLEITNIVPFLLARNLIYLTLDKGFICLIYKVQKGYSKVILLEHTKSLPNHLSSNFLPM